MGYLRRHRWWLIPELVVVAVLAAALVLVHSDRLNDELSERARIALERLSPADLELYEKQHDHESGDTRLLCAAETFGTEPAGARQVEQVQVIYAQYLCAVVQKGTPWDFATRASGPAVITLTDPPVVRIARSGEGYPDRVRALFPESLHAKALAGFTDRDRPAGLLERYNQALSQQD